MEILKIEPTHISPTIRFIPDLNDFLISGMSAPEDVRALYYPVIEWMDKFNSELISGNYKIFSETNPMILKIDLNYFNSASAKFLLDILLELKKIRESGTPVVVEWYYEEDDIDMKEAGEDLSELVEMELKYIIKPA
ncbi:MAG TPA: DUF1987 domain-containing protein [Bacteroidales bacterium]|jgi:hypothetical protein|nr:DUF1987 domain-containing protein [Bacteroidales bacterium]HOX75905.1 DUF1987 domain-containing protein [Bacteroidales bacterium]HPM88847.1 DUF1987 domain-containing protein [Bacteroidales bacterium]HQM70519.1 DUF1987 domain-containing protein [Bacteroidales bacterium]